MLEYKTTPKVQKLNTIPSSNKEFTVPSTVKVLGQIMPH